MTAKPKPLLLKPHDALAYQNGKTQFRVLLKPQPIGDPWYWEGDEMDPVPGWFDCWHTKDVVTGEWLTEETPPLKLPFQPGDVLYGKEAFKRVAAGEVKNGYGEVRYGTAFKADGFVKWAPRATIIYDLTGQPSSGPMQFQSVPWRPSPNMHIADSRLWLEVTEVRVQRLQDMSLADVYAEGVSEPDEVRLPLTPAAAKILTEQGLFPNCDPFELYKRIWNAHHKPEDAWESNKWVCAVTVKKTEKPG